MAADIEVEVVFARADVQKLVTLRLPIGASVADAIEAYRTATGFPQQELQAATVGVWGQVTGRDRLLVAGDRVELYRPLRIDPREARRLLAEVGKTMRTELEGDDQRAGSSS